MKLLSVDYPKTEETEKTIQSFVDFYAKTQQDQVLQEAESYQMKEI